MRIGFVTSRFPPARGGLELHTQRLVHELATTEECVVVTSQLDEVDRGCLGTSLFVPGHDPTMDGNVPVRPLALSTLDRIRMAPALVRLIPGLRGRLYHPLRALADLFLAPVLADLMAQRFGPVDLIHVIGQDHLGTAARRLASRQGIPCVFTPAVHPGSWGDGPLDVDLYRRADGVIALTDHERAWYIDRGVAAERVHVTGIGPVGPDVGDGTAFRRRHGIEGPLVLFLGVKREYKGWRLLVEAAPLIWSRHPAATIVLAGPRTAESRAYFQTMKNQADSRIVECDALDEQEKAGALAACDVLALPSAAESFGGVVVEAWTHGKPVVVSDLPALTCVVSNGVDGRVVERQPQALAEGINWVLDDPLRGTALGLAGKGKAQGCYSWSRLAALTRSVYALATRCSGTRNNAGHPVV